MTKPAISTESIVKAINSALPSITTHNGEITIENPKTGQHRTFRIKTEKWCGKRVLSLLTGSNNEGDYTNFAFVTDHGVSLWKKHKGTDFAKFAKLLGDLAKCERSGLKVHFATRCRRCNRKLTTPESIVSGIGPICATK